MIPVFQLTSSLDFLPKMRHIEWKFFNSFHCSGIVQLKLKNSHSGKEVVMQTLHQIFNEIGMALMKKGFFFEGAGSRNVCAYNKNYISRPERINLILEISSAPMIILLISNSKKKDEWSLAPIAQKAIMREYMEHFDLTSKGAVIKVIQKDYVEPIDVNEIANVLTRAYSLAVTAE